MRSKVEAFQQQAMPEVAQPPGSVTHERLPKSKNILCVISTGFQLMNAVELLLTLGRSGAADLLIIAEENKVDGIVKNVENYYRACFSAVYIIIQSRFSLRAQPIRSIVGCLLDKRKIGLFIENGRGYDTLILGHAPPFAFGYLVKGLAIDNIYIVDDGLRTLHFLTDAAFRKAEESGRYKVFSSYWFLRHLYAVDGAFQKKSNFFSIFSDEAQCSGYPVLPNTMTQLQSALGVVSKKTSSERHFLGQPLVESGIIARGIYLSLIKKIADSNLKNFVYIPHPAEGEELLGGLSELGVNVRRLHSNYELFLYGSNQLPAAVESFYSTAVFCLSKVFFRQSNFVYYDATDHFLKIQVARRVKALYSIMEDKGMGGVGIERVEGG